MRVQLLFERMVYPPGEVKAFKAIKKIPVIKKLIDNMGNRNSVAHTDELIEQCKTLLTEQFLGCLTLVRAAIEYEDLAIVELFLKAGLPVDTPLLVVNKEQKDNKWIEITPLVFAINLGYTDLALLFLRYQANVEILSKQNKHALAYAAQKGNIEIAQAILAHHSLSDLEKIGISPLITATATSNEKSVAMVKYLLAQKAMVNINYVSAGETIIVYNPLTVAIIKNNHTLVALFLEHGALLGGAVVHNAISQAVALNQYSLLDIIFSYSKDCRFEYINKFHPYYYLPKEQNSRNKLVTLLFHHNVITFVDLKFLIFRMRVVDSVDAGDVRDIVNDLHKNRTLIEDEQFESLRYYLCYLIVKKSSVATIKGSSELFVQLLHKGGAVLLPSYPGKPCLLHATIYYGHVTLFNLLVQHGVDWNQADLFQGGQTALIPIQVTALCRNENKAIELIQLLMAYGGDINASAPVSGETVLFSAVYNQKLNFITYLLGAGSDVTVKNNSGKTVLTRAIELKLPVSIIKMLLGTLPINVDDAYYDIKLAAVCQHIPVVSLFIDAYLRDESATQRLVAHQNMMNILIHLIKIGFSIPELDSLIRCGSAPNSKISTRYERFIEELSRFIIDNVQRLSISPPALVCITLLCGAIQILKSDGDNKCKMITEFLSAFDLHKVFMMGPQATAHLTLIAEAVSGYYHAQIAHVCNQLVAEKRPSVERLQRITDAMILLNKQHQLQQSFCNIFSLIPSHTTMLNSLSCLLHEQQIKLQELSECESRQESQDSSAKITAANLILQERERLLQQETERLKQKEQIKSAQRQEQSLRDRQRHSEFHEHAVRSKKRIKYCSAQQSNELKPIRTVALTEPVQKAFALLNVIPGEHYLVGSSVINLLFPERILAQEQIADMDMVVVQEGKLDKKQIKEVGFFRSKHIQGLHTLKKYQLEVDVMVKSTKKTKLRTTDFRICQLQCDSKGNIYDPTGKGISDLEQWILSTAYDSYSCLKDDLVRILRAMKYMLRGYKPDEQLIIALCADYPPELVNAQREHLNASMRKYLYSDNARQMVAQLLHYKLLYPLFGVKTSANLDEVIVDLWTAVLEKKPFDLGASSSSPVL